MNPTSWSSTANKIVPTVEDYNKACFERDQALSDAEKYKKDSDGFHYRNKELQLENKKILHNVSEEAIVRLNKDSASLKGKLLKADLENEALRTEIAALKKKEDENILKKVNALQNQINDMMIINKEKEVKEDETKKELLEELEKRSEKRIEEALKKQENAGSEEQKESKKFADQLSKKDQQIDWLQKRVEQMEGTKQLDDDTKEMKEKCIKVLEKDVANEICEREKKTLMIEVLEKQIEELQARVEQKKIKIGGLKKENDELKTSEQELRAEYKELEAKFDQSTNQKTIKFLQKGLVNLEKVKIMREETIKELEKKIAIVDEENKNLKNKMGKMENQKEGEPPGSKKRKVASSSMSPSSSTNIL